MVLPENAIHRRLAVCYRVATVQLLSDTHTDLLQTMLVEYERSIIPLQTGASPEYCNGLHSVLSFTELLIGHYRVYNRTGSYSAIVCNK